MYIPNFSSFAQFGGQLWEEQSQKMIKPDQKTTALRQSRNEIGLKSRDSQKAHLWYQLNIRTKF